MRTEHVVHALGHTVYLLLTSSSEWCEAFMSRWGPNTTTEISSGGNVDAGAASFPGKTVFQ